MAAFVDALPLNLRLRKGGIPYPRLKMNINSSDLCSRVTRYGDRYQTESLIWAMHLQLPNTHLGFVPMRLLCFKHPYLANESKFPFCKNIASVCACCNKFKYQSSMERYGGDAPPSLDWRSKILLLN